MWQGRWHRIRRRNDDNHSMYLRIDELQWTRLKHIMNNNKLVSSAFLPKTNVKLHVLYSCVLFQTAWDISPIMMQTRSLIVYIFYLLIKHGLRLRIAEWTQYLRIKFWTFFTNNKVWNCIGQTVHWTSSSLKSKKEVAMVWPCLNFTEEKLR